MEAANGRLHIIDDMAIRRLQLLVGGADFRIYQPSQRLNFVYGETVPRNPWSWATTPERGQALSGWPLYVATSPGGRNCHKVVYRPKIMLIDNRHRGFVEEMNQDAMVLNRDLPAKRSIEGA